MILSTTTNGNQFERTQSLVNLMMVVKIMFNLRQHVAYRWLFIITT